MSERGWAEEYRARNEESEDLALGHVASLEAKVVKLEKELKRRHRKTVLIAWLVGIVIVSFEIWYYSGRH